MPRSIDQRAEEILASLPSHVAKTFKPKELPALHLAREILHSPERGLHMGKCYPLRSGVHVCEDPKGKYAAMYYCSSWKGGTPSGERLSSYDEKAYGKRGCKKELRIRYFNKSAYIDWISTAPEKRGHGKAFWKEIRNFLEKKKCVKRVTLQAISNVEAFYESLGFVPLMWKKFGHTGEWTEPKYRYVRAAAHLRPEDEEWIHKFEHYKPYEFILHPNPGCEPKGPKPVRERQTKLSQYGKKWYL